MRASFHQKCMAAIGFLLFCSIGACVASATNAPGAAVRGTQTEIAININRINKGDRVTPSLIQHAQRQLSPLAEGAKAQLQRPPLGCDPAFSSVADPGRAGIYKRCTV
jgi:hypothetical protein